MVKVTHPDIYDVCIIGGGINGAGIARDCAGRGLKVLLVEQGDLAQATSSSSTKLIHGGLRYLEYYEFRLVRESLLEREALLKIAPHIIRPLTFVLPLVDDIRPTWMIRAGLFLYDHLAPRKTLSASRALTLNTHPYGQPLQAHVTRGFSYADCWVDDARLVILNAMSAKEKGATVLTRTQCQSLRAFGKIWTVGLQDQIDGTLSNIKARCVVNAAGPWVRKLLDDNELSDFETPSIRLVQGSHLIVPRLYEGDQAYILQQPDGRIVFALPYEGQYTLIGTTETAYQGDPLKADITAQEIDYLLSAAGRFFKREIKIPDIVRTYSGVRPLFDDEHRDAKAVTRDYRLHLGHFHDAPLVSVFGGKLTTYRKLSEHVTEKILKEMNLPGKPFTQIEVLPGGDDFTWPDMGWATPDLLQRYARSYGSRMTKILSMDRGQECGDGLYEAELRYLIAEEFVRTPQDILWRRSKLGLHVSDATKDKLQALMPALVKEITGYDTASYSGH